MSTSPSYEPGAAVECVPNVSEGRDARVVARIADTARRVNGCYVLDVHSDPDHHRSVVTMAGTAAAVAEAAFRLAESAVTSIDLRRHRGVHPRIGALDVLPFVPLDETTMDLCVALAHEVGRRIGEELQIPVYFYGEAALSPTRRRLADIRRGGFEALAAGMGSDARWEPDAGPRAIGPAGATSVGARRPLIAFNALLATPDVRIAEAVARVLRESNGGLAGVQALGMAISKPGLSQVSMNVTVPATPLHVVVRTLLAEAARHGVEVVETELVGLMPLESALGAAREQLLLPALSSRQVIETSLAAARGPL